MLSQQLAWARITAAAASATSPAREGGKGHQRWRGAVHKSAKPTPCSTIPKVAAGARLLSSVCGGLLRNKKTLPNNTYATSTRMRAVRPMASVWNRMASSFVGLSILSAKLRQLLLCGVTAEVPPSRRLRDMKPGTTSELLVKWNPAQRR